MFIHQSKINRNNWKFSERKKKKGKKSFKSKSHTCWYWKSLKSKKMKNRQEFREINCNHSVNFNHIIAVDKGDLSWFLAAFDCYPLFLTISTLVLISLTHSNDFESSRMISNIEIKFFSALEWSKIWIFIVSSLCFSRLNQEKSRIQSWHSCFSSFITTRRKVRSWYIQYQCFESKGEVDFQCFRLVFVISADLKLMISTFKTWSLLSLHPTLGCSCAYYLENLRRACRHLSSNQMITARKRSSRTCTFPRSTSGSTSMIHSYLTRTPSL